MPPVKPCREFGHLTRTTRAGIRALAMQIKVGRKKEDGRRRGLPIGLAVLD